MISVSVKDLTGKTIWGPKKVDSSILGGQFSAEVTKDLGKHFSSKFVFKEDVLDAESSLSVQGVVDGSYLSMVLSTELVRAKAVYGRALEALAARPPNPRGDKNPKDAYAVPETTVPTVLKEIAKDMGIEALPESIAAWMEVLLTSGKRIDVGDEDFSLAPPDWLDIDGKGPPVEGKDPRLKRPRQRMFYPKGLLYLNMFGNNDNVLMHIVDVEGELGRIYGNGDKGSVWYANVWSEIYEVEGHHSTEFWQQVKDGTCKPGGHKLGVDVSPVCVAPCLERFFEAIGATGKPPRHQFIRAEGKGKGGYGPNEACTWLEGEGKLEEQDARQPLKKPRV